LIWKKSSEELMRHKSRITGPQYVRKIVENIPIKDFGLVAQSASEL
jgi:hypothetical protein